MHATNMYDKVFWPVYSCVTLLPMLIDDACKFFGGGLVNITQVPASTDFF